MSEIMVGVSQTDVRSIVEISAGERVVVKIFNSDGSEKSTLIDTAVPGGKNFKGSVAVYGMLADAV